MHFPINYLRNVALNATNTPFVFLADVDFLPMPGKIWRTFRFWLVVSCVIAVNLAAESIQPRKTYALIQELTCERYNNDALPN